MPGEPPPSRYRVVERGRRLEVIDTRMGSTALPAAPAPDGTRRSKPPIAGTIPKGTTANAPFVTMRLYDDKGPRTVRLDDRAFATVARVRLFALFFVMAWILAAIWQPWLAILPLFLFARNGLGAAIRRRITHWFDGYAGE